MKRAIRMGALAFLFTSVAAHGVASAQDEGNPCGGAANPCGGGEANPCGGEANPCGGGEAAAGGEATAGGEAAAGEMAAGHMGMTLPKGGLQVGAALQLGMNASVDVGATTFGGFGKPFAIAPDVSYGVSDKLTASFETSVHALTGFWSGQLTVGGLGVGTGLCLSGDNEGGCQTAFNTFGLEGMFDLGQKGPVLLGVHGGLVMGSLDDGTMSLKAGLSGQWTSGKIMVMFDPSLYIGLTDRTDDMDNDVNVEQLFLPVALAYMVSPQLDVGFQTGISGQLAHFGDTYLFPLSLGAMYAINPKLNLGGALSFDALAHGVDPGPDAFDTRSLVVFATWTK